MSFSKKITINTFSQLFGRGAVVVFGALATMVLRRYLGRSVFGEYVFVISLATMFSTLADFGSHLVCVREASQREEKQGLIVGNVIILRLAFSLVVFGLFLLLKPFFLIRGKNLGLALTLSSLLILVISFKNSLAVIFHTKLKLFYLSLLNFFISFFNLAGAFFLSRLGEGKEVFSFILLLVVANLAGALIFLPLALKTIKIKLFFNQTVIRKIFVQIAPMGGILVFFTLYSKAGVVILKFFQGSQAVGIFGLAQKIYENLSVLGAYLMNSLLPAFSRLSLEKNHQQRLKSLLQTAFDVLLIGAFGVAVLVFLTAPWLVRVLTGEFLAGETSVLRILSLATFLSFFNHLTSYLIIAFKKQIKSLFISLAALTFNLSVNLLLVPRFSFRAAAWSIVLTEALVLFLSSRVLGQFLGWRPDLRRWPQTLLKFFREKGEIFGQEVKR